MTRKDLLVSLAILATSAVPLRAQEEILSEPPIEGIREDVRALAEAFLERNWALELEAQRFTPELLERARELELDEEALRAFFERVDPTPDEIREFQETHGPILREAFRNTGADPIALQNRLLGPEWAEILPSVERYVLESPFGVVVHGSKRFGPARRVSQRVTRQLGAPFQQALDFGHTGAQTGCATSVWGDFDLRCSSGPGSSAYRSGVILHPYKVDPGVRRAIVVADLDAVDVRSIAIAGGGIATTNILLLLQIQRNYPVIGMQYEGRRVLWLNITRAYATWGTSFSTSGKIEFSCELPNPVPGEVYWISVGIHCAATSHGAYGGQATTVFRGKLTRLGMVETR